MDPASVFGALSGGIQVLQAITSTVHGLKQLYGKFRDADVTIQTLIRELSSIQTALTGLQDWSNTHHHGYKADEFGRDLAVAMDGCHWIMEVLSRDVADLLQGNRSDGGIGLRTRIKAIWNEEMMKGRQEMLRAQVNALQLLLQVFQCRSSTAQMYLLRKPTTRRIISQVADDTETLRSSHTSRAGTDVDSVSRSSSRPTARDQNFALDGGVTNSLVYRWAEQQRVAPRSSLQTNFQSDIAHDVHVPRPLTDECFNSSDTEVFNLRAPYLEKPPQRSRHLSMPNSPSTLEQRAHNKSGKFNQGYLSPSPIISRQWNSDSQITPQSNRSPSSPYGKLSTLFTRSLVHLKALAQGSSSNFPTSPTMSREKINRESDLTPSIDLTTMDAVLVPLIVKAAQAGSESEIQRLIEQGDDVDKCDIQSGRNALLVAAHCGHGAVVELLIRNNAQIAVIDEWGATALHLAASRGHCAVIELLVAESELLEATNFDGQTALRVAADCGQINAIDILLKHNAKVNTRAEKLMTILHVAAHRGDADMTHLLIAYGADIEYKDGSMMTALHYACAMGHVEVVRLLLDRHAQIESPGPAKKTPLVCAAREGMTQVVELLLKRRAATRAADDAGMTALHWAAYNGHDEIVKILSQKKGSLSTANDTGQTPLHLAALRSQFAVVELLLRKNVPINRQCSKGLTALHYACETDSFEITNLLLLTGADIEASNYEHRQRPLHIAAARNSSKILGLLCDQKAMINALDGLGDRPLCVASRYVQVDAVHMLLNRGSPLYYRYENSNREDSPLCLAAKGGHLPVVSLLLERGASAVRKDEMGWQPVRYAAYHGHLDVLQKLLAYGNIPEVDFPEIRALPETIGFAPDADISDEKKIQLKLLLEQAFQHLEPGRRMIERYYVPPTKIQQSRTMSFETGPGHKIPMTNPSKAQELPEETPKHGRSELPDYQVVSEGQKVHPFVLPGYKVISQKQQVHHLGPRATVDAIVRKDARKDRRGHYSTIPQSAAHVRQPTSTKDMPEESHTWPGPRIRDQIREVSSGSSTWPRFPAPHQAAHYVHTGELEESHGHYSTMPQSADQIALLLPTRDIPDGSHTWPGPLMRNHHREHDHIQIGKEPSASHILPQPYAPQQTTPFTGPPASLTTESPPKMADEAIESDLVSNAKAHRKAVRVIYPLSTNRSRIPRPWPQSQQKRNPSFIPTPHLDLDSDSESDSSVYTAPEIPIDLENYMGLKVRNDIHELE